MDFDTMIVGAGQAGCAAAYALAARGQKVVLLDRAGAPRRKACGGCLTTKAVRALGYPINAVVRNVGTHMRMGRGYRPAKYFAAPAPTCLMTVRHELDAFCLERCLERGASLALVSAITGIKEDSGKVELDTNLGALRARYCIGADGAASLVRRLSNEFPEATRGFAVEGVVAVSDPASHLPEFDFFVVPQGYGWIFPKGDHLNVGLYTNDRRVVLKQEMLAEYVRKKLGAQVISGFSAHSLGFGGWKYRPGRDRIFLVGDAAGLVEPLLGEGICNAIVSGQAAAKAILDAEAHGLEARRVFQHELAPIQADVLSCARSADWFYRFPALGFLLLTLPTTRYLLMRGFSGGFRFRTIKSQPWRVAWSRGGAGNSP